MEPLRPLSLFLECSGNFRTGKETLSPQDSCCLTSQSEWTGVSLATLQQPVLDKAHTRFRLLWHWDGTETEIMSRAVDRTGYVQPTYRQLLDARGGTSSYHMNPVTAWPIKPDGRVLHRPEKS